MFWILTVSLLLSVGISAVLLLKNIRLSTQISSPLSPPEQVSKSIESHFAEQSKDALLFVDVSYRIQWANPVFRQWFNLAPHSPLDIPLESIIGTQLFQHSLPAFEQVFQGKEQVINITLSLPKLGERHLQRIYRPVYDSHQRIIGFTGVIQDQTTAHQIRNSLLHAKQEFEHMAQATAHDMRESLRLIRSFSTLLSQQLSAELSHDQLEYLSFIQFESSRMDQFVRDLHQYAQLGLYRSTPEPISMSYVVEEVRHLLRDQIIKTKAEISWASLPTIEGMTKDVTELMCQLLSNALTFQSPSHPPLIHIDWQAVGPYAEISVRDNGIGIAKEHQEQIFSIFRRLHSRSAYPGSGIGLASCKKIIELHRGKIWVESEQNEGSTFRFTLPLYVEAKEEMQEKIPV